MRRQRVVVVNVTYGQESPRNIAPSILRIVLRHLKIDATLCYTNDTLYECLGQVTTNGECGR
jgi:hypothetical protein